MQDGKLEEAFNKGLELTGIFSAAGKVEFSAKNVGIAYILAGLRDFPFDKGVPQWSIKDIELVEKQPQEEETKVKTGAGAIARSKQMSISPECNIIGMRVDEAMPIVDKYLDDAYRNCV